MRPIPLPFVHHSLRYFNLLARGGHNVKTSPQFDPSSIFPHEFLLTLLQRKIVVQQFQQQQPFSTTFCLFKKHIKRERKSTDIASLKATVKEVEEDYDDYDDERMAANSSKRKSSKLLVLEGAQEMEKYLDALNDALVNHLSLKVNLKVYEDLSVTLENGETHRLIKFARISLKTPNGPVVLNFADNPAAIKPAKLAIQTMAENVCPQVDGIVIHVPVPKLTRERREALATHSATRILNDFKLALNEVYTKYTKLLERSSNNKEMVIRMCNGLLATKRHMVKMGEDKVKERSQMLLKEIDFS